MEKTKSRNSKKKCKVIGVVSFKGGVGKTSCTANLACALANMNKRVLAVDSNFSSPNLALNFGLLSPQITLRDALANKAKIEDAIHIHESNVHIIPGSPIFGKFNLNRFRESINRVRNLYDFILLDCSPSLNHELVASLMASDEILIVSTSDYPTLMSTMRAAKISKDKRVNVKGIILNRTRGRKFELSKQEIEEATGLPVIAVLPEDEKAIESSSNLMPILLYLPYRKISQEYRRIAALISNEEYIPETVLSKAKDFMTDRYSKYNAQFKDFLQKKFERQ